MSQPAGNDQPEWVKNLNTEPEWVKRLSSQNNPGATPPPRSGGYEAGRQDQELITAVRALPEQVVNALRSAIEAATPQPAQQQQPSQQQSAQQTTEQQGSQQQAPLNHDTAPRANETFADKWFGNKLFT
jgi:hypothetical protein